MNKLRKVVLVIATASMAAATLFNPGTTRAADGYQYPCSPWTVSGYNFRQYVSGWGYHAGQDIGCPTGKAVYSAADGVVKYSALTPDSWRWGNLVMIEHTNPGGSKVVSLYGHLGNDRQVEAGDTVRKGTRIGSIGSSYSRANGRWAAHLHFQMRPGGYGSAEGTYWSIIHGYESKAKIGQYTNPTTYINRRRVTYAYNLSKQTPAQKHRRLAQYWVEFRLRNTGSATWQKENVRLGTRNNYVTGFSNDMVGQGWTSRTRIALQNDTAPGKVGVFRAKFNNRGIPAGRYRVRFRPLVEGVGWLRDNGMYAEQRVLPPVYAARAYRASAQRELSYDSLEPTHMFGYLSPGGKLNLKAFVKNTGDIAWSGEGNHPIRLATDRRANRKSAFATTAGGNIPPGEGWINKSRPSGLNGIYDPSDKRIRGASKVEPGEIGVFSFTIKAPRKAGTYLEHFRPVLENKRRLNGGLRFRLRVLPKGNHFEWVGQDNPAAIALGRGSAVARVYVRNSGQSPWSLNGPVRLGTDRKRNHGSAFKGPDWQSVNRVSRIDAVDGKDEGSVDPGQVARFDFRVSTTTRPDGRYSEYFRPVADGIGWMKGNNKPITVRVQSPAYDYAIAGQSYSKNPADLKYGDKLTATIRVKNYGNRPWPVSGVESVRLGTADPQDRQSVFAALDGPDAWLSASRPSTIDGIATGSGTKMKRVKSIKQAQVAQFTVPIKVSSAINAGSYTEYFNLVHERHAWLPERGINVPLAITSRTYDYEVLKSDYSKPPSGLRLGETTRVRLAVKNTGRYAWPVGAPNPVRLATNRPSDRQSSYVTLGGSDPWLSRNRASGIDGRITNLSTLATAADTEIQPGETALFSFTLTAAKLGGFSESFTLVQEGRTWFPDNNLVLSGAVSGPESSAVSSESESGSPASSPGGGGSGGGEDQPADESILPESSIVPGLPKVLVSLL